MSLEKFIHLLLDSQLVFTQAARFTDQNEFALHLRRVEREFESHDDPPDSLRDQVEKVKAETKVLKEQTYVSSWSLGRSESYALWKIYLGGSPTGVAIRTTVSRLQRAIKASSYSPSIAQVNYTSYLPADAGYGDLLICSKMSSYEYEREVRLYFSHIAKPDPTFGPYLAASQPPVLPVDVDLGEMIDTVYLSPFAGEWFRSTFRKLINRLSPALLATIKTSDVRDQ